MRSPAPNEAAVKWSIRNFVPPGAGAGANVTFHLPGETCVPWPGPTIWGGETASKEPSRWLIDFLLLQEAPPGSRKPARLDLLHVDADGARLEAACGIDGGHGEFHGTDDFEEADGNGQRGRRDRSE